MKKSAFIYPRAAHARKEYTDGRALFSLYPEYATVNGDGTIRLLTVERDGPLAFSPNNAQSVAQSCEEAYCAVSCGNVESMALLCANEARRKAGVENILNIVRRSGFAGALLHFDGFRQWDDSDCAGFLTFAKELAEALHASNSKLSVCVPAAVYDSKYPKCERPQILQYEDVSEIADQIVVVAMNEQYDRGVGTPVAPLDFIGWAASYAVSHIAQGCEIVFMLPSYGYCGTVGQCTMTKMNLVQAQKKRGFENATRNADGEMEWKTGETYCCYQDETSLEMKMERVYNARIDHVAFWALGNNAWPTT